MLRQASLDALLVSDAANVHYLTGFLGEDSWLLVRNGETILITDSRFADQVEQDCPGLKFDVRRPGSGESLAQQAARVAASTRAGVVGFEKASLSVAEFESLLDASKASLSGADGFVEELRMVKDAFEIEAIRAAVETAERALAIVLPSIQGVDSEKCIADRLDAAVRAMGGEAAAFPTIVASGERAALPHARPTARLCGASPVLLIDWGVRRSLYNSDLTRTLYVGRPTSRFAKAYGVVLRAQTAAIAAIRPGACAGDVDRAARRVIEEAGFGSYFGHGLGHGIGLRVHERPRLGPGRAETLRAGMVVTVEPGVYFKNWGGVRIEDDVLVTRSGREVLSSVPKQLDEIIIQSR
jgi:Xaa-Pro aminopeptidase